MYKAVTSTIGFLLLSIFMYGQCAVNDLSIDFSDCNGDGNYNATINFNTQNPGNEFFDLFINQEFFAFYAISDLPITIENFPDGGMSGGLVNVCINDNPDCCDFVQFQTPDCPANCEIFNIFAEAHECDDEGNFLVDFEFDIEGQGGEGFTVFGNGMNYGNFEYGQIFYTVGPFEGNGNSIYEIIIQDIENPDCQNFIGIEAVDCNPVNDCEITDFVLEPTECDDEGNYDLVINFNVQNGDNNFFDLYYGDELLGFYEVSSLPLTLENFQDNGEFSPFLTVCLNDTPDCCAENEFVAPDCDGGGECAVNDLSIDFSDCNGDGNYNATINFNTQNSGNEFFDLFINQEFFAFYAISDLPITIENFPDGGMSGGLVNVCINDNPDCCDFVQFQTPDCPANCEIFNIFAEAHECDDEGNFLVDFEFDIEGQGGEGFTVFGNGMNYGNFEYGQTFYTVGPFEGNGNSIYEIIIQDIENPDCQNFIGIEAIDCNPVDDCNISEIVANVICEGEEIFFVELNFEFENTGNEGFTVAGNGQNYGNFEYAELPILLGPFEAGTDLNWEFVVIDNQVDDCQNFAEVGEVNCGSNNDCEITDFVLEPTECDDEGNYDLIINFNVQNGDNNFFDLYYGDELLGFYEVSALPLTLENFQDNGEFSPFLTVCLNDTPECCTDNEFVAPDCEGGECFISEIVANVECDGEEIFYVELNFEYENTGNEGFTVAGNGANYGNFEYGALPILLGPFEAGTGLNWEFVVIDNQVDDCQNFVEVDEVNCGNNDDCQIVNTFIEYLDCNGDGNFFIQVGVEVENPVSSSFNIVGNGQTYGNFPYGEDFYEIGPFPGNGSNFELIFFDEDDETCQTEVVFEGIICGGDCFITDFGVEPTECDDDGNYDLIVNFNTQNPSNEFFDLFINQEYFESYSLDELPLTIEDFPDGGLSGLLVSVCVNDNPDCCAFAQFETPDCEAPNCEIFDLFAEAHECDDEGNFLVDFEFEINGEGSEGFTVFGNGMEYGDFEYGQTFYTVGPFEGNGNAVYEIIIQDIENPDCQNFITFEAVNCNAPNLVWPGDANNDNIANNLDVLNMGLAFNATGPERDLMGIEWSPMPAENWDMLFDTEVNFVHADANGNGAVNAEDLAAVDINYNLTHGDFEFEYNETGTANDPELFVDLPNPDLITIGEPFTAPIILGTADIPVDNIYGLAFTLVFDESIIDPASIEIDYNSSWLGQNGTNLLTLDKTIVGEGELDIVLTKNDLNNVSGFGEIAGFIGIIDNIAGKSEVQIEVKDIHAIGNDEKVVPLQRPVEIIEITVSTNNQPLNNAVSIYPNPASDELIIANRLHLPMTSCEIRNADGKLVTILKDGQKKLDVSNLTSGVYLLKFEIDGRMFYERFVKL